MTGDLRRTEKAIEARWNAALPSVVDESGRLDAARLDELKKLAEARQILRGAQTSRLRARLIYVFASIAGLVLLFATLPIREQSVSIDAKTSVAWFTLAQDTALLPVTALERVSLGGLRGIAIDRGLLAPKETIGVEALQMARREDRASSLTLGHLSLGAGSRVSISYDASGEVLIEVLDPSAIHLDLASRGGGSLWLPGDQSDLAAGTLAIVRADAQPGQMVTMRLARSAAEPPLALGVEVSDLGFTHEHEIVEDGHATTQHVSGLKSGSIVFPEIGGKTTALRGRQRVDFTSAVGHLRIDSGSAGLLEVSFDGLARGMQVGFTEKTSSVMPSVLEWLRKRHELLVAWSTSGTLFLLLLGWMRWWRSPV